MNARLMYTNNSRLKNWPRDIHLGSNEKIISVTVCTGMSHWEVSQHEETSGTRMQKEIGPCDCEKMPVRQRFTVYETRVVECLYTVEAETSEEAKELALRGETVEESSVEGSGDVIARNF